jgi:hypothetical protein
MTHLICVRYVTADGAFETVGAPWYVLPRPDHCWIWGPVDRMLAGLTTTPARRLVGRDEELQFFVEGLDEVHQGGVALGLA